jgi:pimeloyl-ACP methyl ester carboxylesterase
MTTRVVRDAVIDAEVPLAVRDHGGDGPDVLLLHGAGRTALDWELLAAALPGFRVVAMDLRCHGLSGDGPWTWRALLEDVEAVIDRVGLERPAVVGHSLGGIVASLWASEHPECPAVVNLDGHWSGTSSLYDGMAPELVEQRLAELASAPGSSSLRVPEEQLGTLVDTHVAAAVHAGVDRALAEESLLRSLRVEDGIVTTRPAAEVVPVLLTAVDSTDLLAVWKATRCTQLVVRCTAPDALPPEAPEWLPEMQSAYRRGLARALGEIETVQPLLTVRAFDGDHGLVWNRPEAVAKVVSSFLATARTP